MCGREGVTGDSVRLPGLGSRWDSGPAGVNGDPYDQPGK